MNPMDNHKEEMEGRNSATSERCRGDPASRAGAVKLEPRTNSSTHALSPLQCPLLMGWISFFNIWCASTARRRSESWESSSTSDKVLMAAGVVGVFNMTWLIVALLHRAAISGRVE
ncbi:hypothetical protein MN608_04273 [Microdochium nivale]|nr:hypothetical protein MN608_04273 [Microdochium nivale]